MMSLNNWKTTAAGVAAILSALTDMATALSHGVISTNIGADITGLIAGVGLIFAKDFNVSGTGK